jgi:hypothetical protein
VDPDLGKQKWPSRVKFTLDLCPVFLTNLEGKVGRVGKVGKVGKEGRLREKINEHFCCGNLEKV